jgi:hypothetical protein
MAPSDRSKGGKAKGNRKSITGLPVLLALAYAPCQRCFQRRTSSVPPERGLSPDEERP